MNLFAKNPCKALAVVIAIILLPSLLRGAPTVSLSSASKHITTNKTFSSTLTVSWKGDPDQYLVEPPRLTLPEGIKEIGSASRSITSGNHHLLEYRFDLRAEKEGDYVIKPVEVSYWAKGNNAADTARTEALGFSAISFNLTRYESYWPLGVLAVIFLSLSITLIVLSTKKKRKRAALGSETPALKETLSRELRECHAYKITGDWENYLRRAIALRDKLPPGDRRGEILEKLDHLAERVHYGGIHPTTDEINRIQRQLEQSLKSVFPHKTDKDGDTTQFQ